jgi:hypothetical protein
MISTLVSTGVTVGGVGTEKVISNLKGGPLPAGAVTRQIHEFAREC